MVTPLPRPRGGEERPVDRRWVRRFYFSGSFLCRHFRGGAHLEGLTTLVDGQQIGDEFARHCQSGGLAHPCVFCKGGNLEPIHRQDEFEWDSPAQPAQWDLSTDPVILDVEDS